MGDNAPMTGNDLIEMLQEGSPSVELVEGDFEKVSIVISPDLSVEHKTVLNNVEFAVNSAREAISMLMQLGKSSGNPRFFETIATLLNSINGANGQLMSVHKQRNEGKPKKKSTLKELPPVNDEEAGIIEGAIIMTAEEAMAKAKTTKV